MKIFSVLLSFLITINALAAGQTRFDDVVIKNGVGIGGTSAADSKAALDIRSTTKGVLLSRMTQAQRDAITSPPTGLLIYNTDSNKNNYYNGTSWQDVRNISETVGISNGGTGQITANAALNALLPSQGGNSAKALITDGSNTSWGTVASSGGSVSASLLTNGGFEAGTGSWSSFNSTLNTELSVTNITEGIKSLKMSFAAQAGHVLQIVTPTVAVGAINMEASCWIKTTLSTIQVCSMIGANEQQCVSAPGDNLWHQVAATLVGPTDGSNVGAKIKTTATATGDVYIDDCYFGVNRGISQVSQAAWVGSITYSACNQIWSGYGAGFGTANSLAPTTCTTTVAGSVQVPANPVLAPGVRIVNQPQGDYLFITQGYNYVAGAGSGSPSFRLWDGTTGTGNVLAARYIGGTAFQAPNLAGRISYPSGVSDKTIIVQFSSDGAIGNLANISAQGAIEFTINVYRYPTSSDTATRINSAIDSIGMLVDVGSTTCPSNSIAADGSAISRTAYSKLFGKIGTTYGAGDGSTTFNLPNAQGVFTRGAGSQTISGIVYTGTQGTTQGDQMQGHTHDVNAVNGGGGAGVPSGGAYALNTLLHTTTQLSDGTNGTPRTGAETRPANIVMKKCMIYDGSITVPLIANSVTTNSAVVERHESAAASCSAGGCTITRQSGSWLTSISRTGLGLYTANFAVPFALSPVCVANAQDPNNPTTQVVAAATYSPTTTSVGIFTKRTDDTIMDANLSLICMGSK